MGAMNNEQLNPNKSYWNELSDLYQKETRISVSDFHYGPLLPGDSELKLLPENMDGLRALEIGCGAGQNSIFLASKGANCVALDISENQIKHGRALAKKSEVVVDFKVAGMDEMNADELGKFDLIHSTYALPFADDPESVIKTCADLLNENGTFILTTGHPLHSGEWLDVDEEADEDGLFIGDYFNLAPDARVSLDDPSMLVQACYYPVSTVANWLYKAGFLIEQILEPQPMPILEMSRTQIKSKVPYWSNSWLECYEQIARVPVVLTFKCIKKA